MIVMKAQLPGQNTHLDCQEAALYYAKPIVY